MFKIKEKNARVDSTMDIYQVLKVLNDNIENVALPLNIMGEKQALFVAPSIGSENVTMIYLLSKTNSGIWDVIGCVLPPPEEPLWNVVNMELSENKKKLFITNKTATTNLIYVYARDASYDSYEYKSTIFPLNGSFNFGLHVQVNETGTSLMTHVFDKTYCYEISKSGKKWYFVDDQEDQDQEESDQLTPQEYMQVIEMRKNELMKKINANQQAISSMLFENIKLKQELMHLTCVTELKKDA